MLLLHLARCINRAIEVETNLREDLTITEKAPKYTNGAFSWHWKLCDGLLQALPCSTISISGVFTDFFCPSCQPISIGMENEICLSWLCLCLHPDLDRSQGSLTGSKCLWRGSKGSVTVSVQVDIRPAEYAAQLKTMDKITSQYSFVIQEQIVLFPRKMNKTDWVWAELSFSLSHVRHTVPALHCEV